MSKSLILGSTYRILEALTAGARGFGGLPVRVSLCLFIRPCVGYRPPRLNLGELIRSSSYSEYDVLLSDVTATRELARLLLGAVYA